MCVTDDPLEAGETELINSDALTFEITRAPNPVRRHFAQETLVNAKAYVALDDTLTARAQVFVNYGVRSLDALHLASAEAAGADYFCACDDKLFRCAKAILNLTARVVSPAELVKEFE